MSIGARTAYYLHGIRIKFSFTKSRNYTQSTTMTTSLSALIAWPLPAINHGRFAALITVSRDKDKNRPESCALQFTTLEHVAPVLRPLMFDQCHTRAIIGAYHFITQCLLSKLCPTMNHLILKEFSGFKGKKIKFTCTAARAKERTGYYCERIHCHQITGYSPRNGNQSTTKGKELISTFF